MADRNRESRDRNQQGSQDEWSRQSQQFEADRSQQQKYSSGESSWDRGGSQQRSNDPQRASGQNWDSDGRSDHDRNQQRGTNSDSISDFDRASHDYRGRQMRGSGPHDFFRPDDYGGGGRVGSGGWGSSYGSIYGGNAQGESNYARTGYSQYSGPEMERDRGFLNRAGDEVASWFGDEEAARRREQDHSGRGPGNYTRSDSRILEDTCDRLTEDRGVDASHIDVTVKEGEVTLTGTVGDRWQKRHAEDCADRVSGVKHVQNNLRVNNSDSNINGNQNKKPPAPMI